MLGLTALVIAAICILQYGAISRVLRPTKDILAGLDRLALGDLSSRLPRFRLIELQRISEAFNTLAANLERTTREKLQLAAKSSITKSKNGSIWREISMMNSPKV